VLWLRYRLERVRQQVEEAHALKEEGLNVTSIDSERARVSS
jgi:hypothetical protein